MYNMAVMSRRKQAVAQGWEAINRQRDEQNKQNEKEPKKKEITEEEHKARLEKLRALGLIK